MKFSMSGLILASLFMMSACGQKSSSKSPTQSEEQNGVTSAYGFNLSGEDDNGNKCQTGARNFDTLEAMCIGLQKPDANDCALDERIEKFEKECEPKGFYFQDSLSCKVSVLKTDSKVGPKGSYAPENELVSAEYCVGYNELGNKTFDTINLEQVVLYQKIRMDLYMTFEPGTPYEEAKKSSEIKFMLETNYGYTSLESKVLYSNVISSVEVHSGPGEPVLVTNCRKTWGCPIK